MKRNYIEKSKVPTGQKSLQLSYACRSIYKSNTRAAVYVRKCKQQWQ